MQQTHTASSGAAPVAREPLLSVRDLATHFPLDEGNVVAVDGVSFDLYEGQTLGIVGESGCGKSVTALSIMMALSRPGRIVDGRILYRKRDGNDGPDEVIDLASLGAQRQGDARDTRRRDRLHLPGAHDRLQPRPHRRQPAHRGHPPPQRHRQEGGPKPCNRAAAPGGGAARRAAPRLLLLGAQRRPAPARHDRRGHGLQPRASSSPTSPPPLSTSPHRPRYST